VELPWSQDHTDRGLVVRSRFAAFASAVLVVLVMAAAAGAAPAAGLSFGAAVHYPTGRGPVAIAVGDFNGDGAPDLVTANARGSTISVLLGNGSGGFAAKSDFATGPNPRAVAVGDFNGDGAQDLVTANGDSNTVSVLLGDGSGGFAAKTDFATGPFPCAVAVGDFNGDGALDLVTADFGGYPLAEGDTVSVLLGNGTGTFAARNDFATGPSPYDVAVGDFNGDGRQDLVTVFTEDFSGEAGVLLNDGAGGFPAMRTFPTYLEPVSVAVGDLNGDGKQDLVTVQRLEGSGAVGVLLGDGAGSFAVGTDVRTSRELFCVALGDFDGDGWQDVASIKQNMVIILRGDGLGGLSKETDFAVGTQSADIAVGDFNGDGKQDLVTADYASNTAGLLLNGAPAVPIIRGLSPARGHSGATVTLTGWHFGAKRSGSSVRFGAKTATRYVSWSATKIRVKVPKGTAKGKVKVTVKTAAGRSAAKGFKRL
jgi:FG-GAP-like repeat/IPT/TIG domain